MNIQEQKESFLNLLRSTYTAQETQSTDDPYRVAIVTLTPLVRSKNAVFIKEKDLRKYGFGDNDFWERICPSLKGEGLLESFEDPNFTSRDDYNKRFIGYEELKAELRELHDALPSSYDFAKSLNAELSAENSSLRGGVKYRAGLIEKELEKKEAELRKLKSFMDAEYPHKFTVTEKFIKNDIKGISSSLEQSRIITKQNNEYFYKGKRIPVKNKEALYFIVFDIIYELNPDGGEFTYQDVENTLEKRIWKGKKIPPLTGNKMRERIRRNLTSNTNGFFHYVKIPNLATKGRPIIETHRGQGIIFYNRLS